MPEIQLSHGTVRYRDEGTGPTIVLIHGLLVNGRVWERLIGELAGGARCIVPDLPLGSHRVPMNEGADLTPPGIARLIAELLERLELTDVTLVGNDTGGALCQLVCAGGRVHERLGRLVLVNCDAFENFPPPAFKPVVTGLGKVPGAVAALDLLARIKFVRGASMKLAPLTVTPIPDELLEGWVAPLHDRRIRRDLVKVLRGIDPRFTLQAAEELRSFERPVLIAWGQRDKFFPPSEADRLAAVFPDARVEPIENARTFVQLDDPRRLGELIRGFVGAAGRAPVAG
jgi:pimeloyl-ACP methyl ester carboxylesterase